MQHLDIHVAKQPGTHIDPLYCISLARLHEGRKVLRKFSFSPIINVSRRVIVISEVEVVQPAVNRCRPSSCSSRDAPRMMLFQLHPVTQPLKWELHSALCFPSQWHA